MRNRSMIDGVVEDVLREMEYELENEMEMGAEFDTPLPIPNYKLKVYTSVDLSGRAWRFDREIIAPKWMDSNDAYNYQVACLKKLASTTAPLNQRIGVQRCVLDGGTWKPDMGHCLQIEVLTGKISACDGAPPRTC
jgi:hypothetical protein